MPSLSPNPPVCVPGHLAAINGTTPSTIAAAAIKIDRSGRSLEIRFWRFRGAPLSAKGCAVMASVSSKAVLTRSSALVMCEDDSVVLLAP